MLHPSQFDLGRPFDYISALYTETISQVGIGGSIGPVANGIRLTVTFIAKSIGVGK